MRFVIAITSINECE